MPACAAAHHPRRPHKVPRGTGSWIFSVAVLVAAILSMYSFFLVAPYWPKLIGTFDYYRFFGPQAFYMDSAIHRGELPLWNPLTLCGTPFAANPQTTLFYPPHLIRSCLTFQPTPWKTHLGLALQMVFHMVLAGIGIFLLVRDYRLSRSAGLVAAFAYIFGPHFMRRVLEQWVVAAVAAWLPLELFLVRRALRADTARGKLYYGCAAGLVFGLSTLAGFLQLTFYTAIIIVLFCALERLVRWKRLDFRAPMGLVRRVFGDGLTLGLLFGIGAVVAAVMLVPALEYIQVSARVRGIGMEVVPAPQDLSPMHLFQSLLVYPGATREEQGCRAAGLGVIFLAVAAAAHLRRRDVLLYALLYLILTDCTLGPPFPFGILVNWIDVCQFSSPWRAGILAGFPLAMLAGFGMDSMARRLKSRFRGILRTAALASVGAVTLVFLARWRHAGAYLPVSSLVLWAPGLTLAALLCAGWLRWPRLWRPLVAALVFAEMFTWNYHFIRQFVTERGYNKSPAAVQGADTLWPDNRRGADPYPNRFFYGLRPAINGYDPLFIARVRQILAAPIKESKYFRFIWDWEVTQENERGNLLLKRAFWLARQYVRGPLPGKYELFPSATTVFLENDVPQLPLPEVHRADLPPASVSERTERVPLADAAQLARWIKTDGKEFRINFPLMALAGLHSALYLRYTAEGGADIKFVLTDPVRATYELGKHHMIGPSRNQKEGLIEVPLPDFEKIQATVTWGLSSASRPLRFTEAYVLRDQSDETGLIHVRSRRANSVELDVDELPDYRILTFLDAAYPGWTAYVDAQRVPIYLADDAFKAVLLPPGAHHVRFVFSSMRVYLGIAISLAGGVAIILFLMRGCRRAR
jgi:hypothetical protein